MSGESWAIMDLEYQLKGVRLQRPTSSTQRNAMRIQGSGVSLYAPSTIKYRSKSADDN